jgi:hypothetical protein
MVSIHSKPWRWELWETPVLPRFRSA